MDNVGRKHVEALRKELDALDMEGLSDIADCIRKARAIIWVAGNGGSQANAAHLALHLNGLGYRAVDLMADTASLTALSNDYGYSRALQRRLCGGTSDDIFIAITGSGDSPNVLVALAKARQLGMTTLGLLGFGGGSAHSLCDHALVLESNDYGVVEDTHSAAIHILERLLKAARPK